MKSRRERKSEDEEMTFALMSEYFQCELESKVNFCLSLLSVLADSHFTSLLFTLNRSSWAKIFSNWVSRKQNLLRSLSADLLLIDFSGSSCSLSAFLSAVMDSDVAQVREMKRLDARKFPDLVLTWNKTDRFFLK